MVTKLAKAIEREMHDRWYKRTMNLDNQEVTNVIPMGPEGVTQAEIDDLQRMVPEGQERAPEAPVRVKVWQNLDDDVAGLEQYRSELEQWREQVQRELQDAEDKISEADILLRHLKPAQKAVAEFCNQDVGKDGND